MSFDSKTLKYITSRLKQKPKRMSCHAYRCRKLQAMTTKLIYMLTTALASEEETVKYQKEVDADKELDEL